MYSLISCAVQNYISANTHICVGVCTCINTLHMCKSIFVHMHITSGNPGRTFHQTSKKKDLDKQKCSMVFFCTENWMRI